MGRWSVHAKSWDKFCLAQLRLQGWTPFAVFSGGTMAWIRNAGLTMAHNRYSGN